MKKMLVTDYDQTFYINDNDIELNKKSVNKFMNLGNTFVIATGRSYLDLKSKQKIYNFKYYYLILNHGATIMDKTNNILLNIPIQNSITSAISPCFRVFASRDTTKIYRTFPGIGKFYGVASLRTALDNQNIIGVKYKNQYLINVDIKPIFKFKFPIGTKKWLSLELKREKVRG